MCGITGIWQAKRRSLSREEAVNLVDAMNNSLKHRGPDAEGVWSDLEGRCALGHRRLSIIDTSDAGRQPFATQDRRWWITYNGELYNFQEIRIELEGAGIRTRGRTDTEVLIEAIALWGVGALTRFDGMFAFAAYDTLTHTMLLARDPFGEKPLYYAILAGGSIAFASELQAFEIVPGVDTTVDVDAVAELLAFQYIGAPRTIYTGVQKLRPGHWMRISAGGEIRTERYFAFEPGGGGFAGRSRADLADELEDILARSVKRRMIADVPLGAFLSGGVDSSTVCTIVRRKLRLPLQTFSTGFVGTPESEHETARLFAGHLGTDHHEQLIEPQAAQFLRDIGGTLDEPNADSSCLPVYMLSQFARQHVTVALSGDGGDELFGGYGRYLMALEQQAAKTPEELRTWCPGDTYYGGLILVSSEPHLEELLGFVPPRTAQHLAALRADIDGGEPAELLTRMRRTDVNNYMPGAVLSKVDRMAMRHALEVRAPFLNVELARFAERLPTNLLVENGRGKILLRELAYRYLPREQIDLPKQGFGLPMSDWGRQSLLAVASELLLGDECRALPLFGREGIGRFLERQNQPGGFRAYQVWALAVLESWLRHHPAVVPDLGFRRPKIARVRVPLRLAATRIGEGLWLAGMTTSDAPVDLQDTPAWRQAPAVLHARVAQLLAKSGGARTTPPDTVQLPDWGHPLASSDPERLSAMRNATVVLLDADAEGKLEYSELVKFASIGVGRLVYFARSDTRATDEIRIQWRPLKERLLNCAMLFLRSRAMIANRRLLSRPFHTARFDRLAGAMCHSAKLRKLAPAGAADLSNRYAVFEGIRQLPPIETTPKEICEVGGGRYSIADQSLKFSPTHLSRLYLYPYWIIERTPKLERRLQFVRDRHRIDMMASAVLNAARVTDRSWVVVRLGHPLDLRNDHSWRIAPRAVLARVCELFDAEGPADHEVVQLSDWNHPTSHDDLVRLSALRRATLVFLDADVGGKLDFAAMTKFAQIGISRLIFAASGHGKTEEILLQPKSLHRRMLHCARLLLRARAFITNRWLFTIPFLTRRFNALGGELCEAKIPGRLGGGHDDDSSHRYMAFEGIRQLPPVRTSPDDITAKGGGRYTISGRHLAFSPTEPARRYTHPYWLVERNPKTEPLLQFVPQELRSREDPRKFVQRLDHAVGRGEGEAGFALEPGDPIVLFTHALPPGGAERQWVYLAQGLVDLGYHVTFVTYVDLTGENGHYLPLLEESAITLCQVPSRQPLTLPDLLASSPLYREGIVSLGFPDPDPLLSTTQAFSQLKPKAVLAQLDYPNLLASHAALLAGVPRIVMSFRNYNPSNFDYIYADWMKHAYRVAASSRRVLFSGNSTLANHDYEDWIGLEHGRVSLIPNAIEPRHFPRPTAAAVKAAREELGIQPSEPVVLGVFRLTEEKEPANFVEVCAGLVAIYPKLRALVAGTGQLLPQLQLMVRERGLESNIKFIGRRSDIATLMTVADLLLLTSKKEGMPNVVLEAQLMGLPVVATDVGGTPDALVPNVTGFLCPVGDVAALRAACLCLLRDEALAQEMGEAGRRHAAVAFDKHLMAQRYLDLLSGRDPMVTTHPQQDGERRSPDKQTLIEEIES
jgi:asparagine synthase (glutamine-hydrolysing)